MVVTRNTNKRNTDNGSNEVASTKKGKTTSVVNRKKKLLPVKTTEIGTLLHTIALLCLLNITIFLLYSRLYPQDYHSASTRFPS